MNRKLLVTLLSKNIEELNVITDGFMEMNNYPASIIYLAKRKTEDIQLIIDQLAAIKEESEQMAVETKIADEEIVEEIVSNENIELEAGNDVSISDISIEEIIPDMSQEETMQIIETTSVETEERIVSTTEEMTVSVTETDTELVIETNESKQLTELNSDHEIIITTEETKKTTIADKIINPTV